MTASTNDEVVLGVKTESGQVYAGEVRKVWITGSVPAIEIVLPDGAALFLQRAAGCFNGPQKLPRSGKRGGLVAATE